MSNYYFGDDIENKDNEHKIAYYLTACVYCKNLIKKTTFNSYDHKTDHLCDDCNTILNIEKERKQKYKLLG